MNRQLRRNRMGKQQFFRVLVPAFEEGLNAETVRKDYKNSEVYPINPNAEKLKNIGASAVYDRCKLVLRMSKIVNLLNDKQVIVSG